MRQFTGFSQRKKKKRRIKRKGYRYLSIRKWKAVQVSSAFNASQAFDMFLFGRIESLEKLRKKKPSCGSLQGSDSCRISISHEGLMKVTWTSHESDIRGILPTFEDLPKILGVMKVL